MAIAGGLGLVLALLATQTHVLGPFEPWVLAVAIALILIGLVELMRGARAFLVWSRRSSGVEYQWPLRRRAASHDVEPVPISNAALSSEPALTTPIEPIVRQAVQDTFTKAERLMPELLAEMRKDLSEFPARREFVVLKRGWSFNSGGQDILAYYFDDHPELENQLQVLENLLLIRDVTRTNVKRYRFMEAFVDYLTQ